jgi:hypothetical protein
MQVIFNVGLVFKVLRGKIKKGIEKTKNNSIKLI